MANDIAALVQQSNETVAALIDDGASTEELFTIEHHLVSTDFTKLEKAAVELVKVGYHVDDADEFELDDGSRLFAFVAEARVRLEATLLAQQTEQVGEIANETGVEYDGWGTYFDTDTDEAELH
ncbi:ribonuclease E inhibitor RraB [Pseudidiomarina sediminum]|uniref:ribonuclease E inhibitor RraB n=1 Tax=Pseudidiomarina sediminum TaxID=431675 RepID=UPI001C95A78C|nr:ribonuclease E inhibitor RraB [Pseudidiomarina sediminum]MBY6064673.1 ribonuclease E inhibitor RraB [Pseudidiomarina sediminum]